MIGIFIIIGNYVALVTLLALPVHAKSIRSVEVEAPMCRRHGNHLLEFLNKPHQMIVTGIDSKFHAFAEKYIKQDPSLKSKDFWLFEETDSVNEARLKRRLDSDDNSQTKMLNSKFHNYRLCKSDPVVERRFDKFPFIKISWTCKKNTRLVKNLDFECIPVQEERPILKISHGCLTFNTAADESWEHSTELVNTGCQAILKLKEVRP
ncbi:uncharacterized protein LOC134825268 isoform X3 [Bolinopsis microptera]|uniref:uncharacterized protein LOC134825268 isoform X3 n=1 Tax=Bolinopsis microptera TaxID=2820187 RepID=UPI0030793178